MTCTLVALGSNSAEPLQRWSAYLLLGETIPMLDEALTGLSLFYTCPSSKQDNLHSFLLECLLVPRRMTSRKVNLAQNPVLNV